VFERLEPTPWLKDLHKNDQEGEEKQGEGDRIIGCMWELWSGRVWETPARILALEKSVHRIPMLVVLIYGDFPANYQLWIWAVPDGTPL
jgi:hypothetical protein